MPAHSPFRISVILAFSACVLTILLPPAFGAEVSPKEVLAPAAPRWNVGDTWKYATNKPLDRNVTQNLGMFQIGMRLERVETTTTHTVTGTEAVDGEECYSIKIEGNQKITGSYSTTPTQGDAQDEGMSGSLLQTSTFEGFEYRRVSDLAFVKTLVKASGTIEIGGILQGFPVPFQSDSLTVAKPPVKQFTFPLVKGGTWHISSTVTTTTSGTSSDTVVITYNYDSTVLGTDKVTTDDGKTYEAVAIQQEGNQVTQSQNSGISIEPISGKLYFAPSVGNTVLDEAEDQKLLEYTPAGAATANPAPSPAEPGPQ